MSPQQDWPQEIIGEYAAGSATRLEKTLGPTGEAGMRLATGVGILISLVIAALIADWVFKAPSLKLPADLIKDPDKAKMAVDNLRSLSDLAVERSTKVFDVIIARGLLPVFTAILGYIFGTRSDNKND